MPTLPAPAPKKDYLRFRLRLAEGDASRLRTRLRLLENDAGNLRHQLKMVHLEAERLRDFILLTNPTSLEAC